MRPSTRLLFPLLAGLLSLPALAAEVQGEAIPKEFLQQFAPVALGLIQEQFPNPPIKVDADTEAVNGSHVLQKSGVVVYPAKELTGAALNDLKDKPLPVAIVTSLGLSPLVEGIATPADRLNVADFNGTVKFAVLYLAVRVQGEDRLLDVFSKDMKPLVTVPMKKLTGEATKGATILLDKVDIEKKQGEVLLSFAGAYEARIKVGATE